jgi:hypothetical protein
MRKSCIHAFARTAREYDRSVRKRGGSALNLARGLETTRKEPQNGASLYDCHLKLWKRNVGLIFLEMV